MNELEEQAKKLMATRVREVRQRRRAHHRPAHQHHLACRPDRRAQGWSHCGQGHARGAHGGLRGVSRDRGESDEGRRVAWHLSLIHL